MSIRIDSARKIARSLMGLDNKPATPEAFEALASAFASARSDAEAEAIAKGWLRDETDVPKPAAIYEIIHRLREGTEAWKPFIPTDCLNCGGSGWRTIIRGPYEAAERCGCQAKKAEAKA